MSLDISILYYTNNLLSKDLLSYSLKETIKHCKNNKCEFILSSHFPLSEKYENVKIGDQDVTNDPIYDYLVRQPVITEDDTNGIDHKMLTVGKLPYSYLSIYRQILISLERCKGRNVILMEHDCLYPDNYINAVKKALIEYRRDFSYCSFATCYLNREGFFKINSGSYCLSGCSGKKDLLIEIFKRKIKLAENNEAFKFEPIINIMDALMILKEKAKGEIIISDHICIDTFIKDGCILDIKHNLNADGLLVSKDYFHYHPYWGEDKKYIDMINVIPQAKWNYGIAKFDY